MIKNIKLAKEETQTTLINRDTINNEIELKIKVIDEHEQSLQS